MKIAAVQFEPAFLDKETNLQRVEALCPDHADLVVFPELALSGYQFLHKDEVRQAADTLDGATVTRLVRLAQARQSYLVIGLVLKEGKRLSNAALLIGPDGVLGSYRKVHLFHEENLFFTPGETPWPVIELPNGLRVGLMICFDWFFPESARSLALQGAQVIAHPSNLVLPYCQRAMPIRALENKLFTITANRTGTETRAAASLRFSGQSLICSPKAEVLAQAGETDEAVLLCEVDPREADDKLVTPFNNLVTDRQPALYSALSAPNPVTKKLRPNVCMMVQDNQGRLLCGEREDRPGAWQLPQGGIDAGETPTLAALRELKEETGLEEVEIQQESNQWYDYLFPTSLGEAPITKHWSGQRQRFFLLRAKEGYQPDLSCAKDEEFSRLAWLTPEDLLHHLAPFKREALKKALREFGIPFHENL